MWVIFQHPSGNFSPDERQAVPGIELVAGSLKLSYMLIRSINCYNVIKLKTDSKICTNNLCQWVQNFRVPVDSFTFCNVTHVLNKLHIPMVISFHVHWNPGMLCISFTHSFVYAHMLDSTSVMPEICIKKHFSELHETCFSVRQDLSPLM